MLLSAMALVLAAVGAAAAAAPASIRPGVPWNDTDGNLIDAHGAGLLLHAGRYYWYGSRRTLNATGTQNDGGIALYSSADLYSWRFESLVLPVFNCSSPHRRASGVGGSAGSGAAHPAAGRAVRDEDRRAWAADYPPPSCKNANGLDLERPKVVQCGGPGSGGKFVMWVRGTGYGNSPQLLAVLEADSPIGPFRFVSNATGSDDPFRTIAKGIMNYPPGYQFADATLYQDPQTHKTFVYWRTRITTGLSGPTGFRGMQLTDDCRDVVPESDTRITATPNREGPAMFKHNGTYYLWVSGTMGWQPTTMYLYSAASPLGAFENSSQPGHGWHAYSKGVAGNSSGWNGTWTVRSGYLASGAQWGKTPKQNVTLPKAEAQCAAADDCAGFTFNDYEAAPAATKVLSIAFKTRVNFVAEHSVGLQPSPIPAPGQPGNRAPEQPGKWAYDSQSTYIIANPHYTPGSKLAPFIYMGDRWDYTAEFGTSHATYIWLPLYIDPSNQRTVKVVWSDEWRLDDPSLYPFDAEQRRLKIDDDSLLPREVLLASDEGDPYVSVYDDAGASGSAFLFEWVEKGSLLRWKGSAKPKCLSYDTDNRTLAAVAPSHSGQPSNSILVLPAMMRPCAESTGWAWKNGSLTPLRNRTLCLRPQPLLGPALLIPCEMLPWYNSDAFSICLLSVPLTPKASLLQGGAAARHDAASAPIMRGDGRAGGAPRDASACGSGGGACQLQERD